jgi:hypothetical protein
MGTGYWLVLFAAGVAVSLAASWLLVSRLERLGERAGFSEAWLGLVAALAADAPEITSAVTALARGQSSVGAGVVIGSNVFNLAALLGLAAVVAGRIGFHRRVVLLGGPARDLDRRHMPADRRRAGYACGRAGARRAGAGAVRRGARDEPGPAGTGAATGLVDTVADSRGA